MSQNVKFNSEKQFSHFLDMRLLRCLFGFFLAVSLLISVHPLAAQAASSAAIRAYDDVEIQTKDYSRQDLARAEFTNANLVGANFKGADLRGAVFNGSNLTKASLQGADLTDGIAYLSDFAEADLSDAVLTSAMLLKSNFRGATITGADFSFALLDRAQVVRLCETARGVNSITGVETRDSLECP